MTMTKLIIPPDQDGYSAQDGNEVVSTKLDGGASRRRRDIVGSTSIVNVKWSADPDTFEYLRAFYLSVSKTGALPFLIDLYLDNPVLTEHEVSFVENSMKFPNQRGLKFTVSAQLEVKPITPNDEYNQSIVDMWNIYGSWAAAEQMMNQLAIFANEDLPGSLPGD